MLIQIFLGIVISLAVSPVRIECLDARITSWIQSTGYGYGAFSGYRANVMQIYYTQNKVFVNANSIPSYSIGPWNKNPNNASAQNYITSFPMSPSGATSKTATALGVNGLYTNGVAIFNGWDGTSYNSVWQQNAYVYEGVSFDSCNGHPSGKSVYHNHVNPVCLYDSTDSSSHSPIIGWMFDGYPLYGPFGYSSANDSSSSIKRLLPSYSLRTYANNQRTSLANGTVLSPAYYGPDVNANYPVGNYIQDYEYVSGSGDLDEYNGRWCVTPDYPSGTYAYFIATNSSGLPTYPYTIGPYYYGTVSSTSTSQNIPSAATKYFSIY